MKTTQMASVRDPREQCDYAVIRNNEAETNPYTVYKVWYCMGKHRKQLARYADYASALHLIADRITNHNVF